MSRAKRIAWIVLCSSAIALGVLAWLLATGPQPNPRAFVHPELPLVIYEARGPHPLRTTSDNLLLQITWSAGDIHCTVRTHEPQTSQYGTHYYDSCYDGTGTLYGHVHGGCESYEPDAYPSPHTAEEVRAILDDAKLFVQQEATDGELVLPTWWEAVE